MRLSAIKLAGFKSFVDPTTVLFEESLIGIVGPNGCGKSNIVDAIRWVLGESKASSLRGENLADVIFNGSDQRKAVDRASVELIFDNSDGRITGQWGQFTEISVRRILNRQGDSLYQINRQNVRRKDVTALFLGTGLGARGYSIIEQGTISRLIEAKPDEMRLTLEEAAGVSKYRERRKETEHRLSDAKGHLDRLVDVSTELTAQIEKLSLQAEVAKRYRALVTERLEKKAQQAVWILNQTMSKGARLSESLSQEAIHLEKCQTAKTTAIADIERQRVQYQTLNDQLDAAQAAFYHANGEVIRIETDIQHHHMALDKMKQQLGQLAQREQHAIEEQTTKRQLIEQYQTAFAEHETRLQEAIEHIDALTEESESIKEVLGEAQSVLDQINQEKMGSQRALELEGVNHRHATQTLDALSQRKERLEKQHAEIELPPEAEISTLEILLEEATRKLETVSQGLEHAQEAKAKIDEQLLDIRADIHQKDRQIVDLEAQLRTLKEQQAQSIDNELLDAWMKRHEFSKQIPLWELLTVESGWETAIEAILRERIMAGHVFNLTASRAFFKDRPPVKLTLCAMQTVFITAERHPDLCALKEKVTVQKAEYQVSVDEWLAHVYICDSAEEALEKRECLPYGGCFVTPTGDVIGRNSVSWFAAESPADTMLTVKRRVDELTAERAQLTHALDGAREMERSMAEESRLFQTQIEEGNDRLKSTQQQIYQDRLRLTEAQHRRQQAIEQEKRLHSETEEITQQIDQAIEQRARAEAVMEHHETLLAEIEERFEAQAIICEQYEETLGQLVTQRQTKEAEANQYRIEMAGLKARKTETEHALERLALEHNQIQADRERAQADLLSIEDEQMSAQLTAALEARQKAEQVLSEARNTVDEAAKALHSLEAQKNKIEADIVPIQENMAELRLNIQAESLKADQQRALLKELGVEPADIQLPDVLKENELQNRLRKLDADIESLGAVNLAAIEELTAAEERESWMKAQMDDIESAIETLEDAIRRIDREARALLQKTFDLVNANFGKLFPILFGGGQAKLVIEGEDLLAAGVRILAQPPGKRNSTIFLLSGGEKALTAVALVFALFELNPAPFCLLDEIDAPLDDPNTVRLVEMIRKMSESTQFLFITHNKITMELAQRLVGVTMPESGVSRIVDVNIADAIKMTGTTG